MTFIKSYSLPLHKELHVRNASRGVSESMDGQGCAILALELVPKSFDFRIKILPKNLFYKTLCLLIQQGKMERATSFVSHE